MTFKTSNEGGSPHELVVLKTTLGASRLPVKSAAVYEAATGLLNIALEPSFAGRSAGGRPKEGGGGRTRHIASIEGRLGKDGLLCPPLGTGVVESSMSC